MLKHLPLDVWYTIGGKPMDCKSPLDVRNMSQCQAQIESVVIGTVWEIVYHTPYTSDRKKPFLVEKCAAEIAASKL